MNVAKMGIVALMGVSVALWACGGDDSGGGSSGRGGSAGSGGSGGSAGGDSGGAGGSTSGTGGSGGSTSGSGGSGGMTPDPMACTKLKACCPTIMQSLHDQCTSTADSNDVTMCNNALIGFTSGGFCS